MNPWYWAIGALAAAVAEIVSPGFYLIWLAAGAAVTALAGFVFATALTAQLLIFAIASAVTCVIGYFIYQKMMAPSDESSSLNRRERGIVGATGTVFETIVNGSGKVTLGDSVWLAEGPDLAIGSAIIVTGTRGTIVIVTART